MSRRPTVRSGSLRMGLVLVGVVVGLLSLPTASLAASPEIIRIPVDETFDDDFLTEVCGVPVVTTVQGSIAIRLFDRETTGPLEVFTINLGFTARSPDGVARFRDVGADLYRITSDGSLIQQVMGQVPFEFAGVARWDAVTTEPLKEPRDRSEWQVDRICAALSGA
jgi:hypothetical protein